ncbi:MAG: hypothetical protein Q9160_006214 [Pyrenula sp. 1 TL-2023]
MEEAVEKNERIMLINLLHAARLGLTQLEAVLLRMIRNLRAKAPSKELYPVLEIFRSFLVIFGSDTLTRLYYCPSPSDLRILSSLGLSIHEEWFENHTGRPLDFQRKGEGISTFTSYAMWSSARLADWQSLLVDHWKVDLEEFVRRELNGGKGLLATQGWTNHTLLALLKARIVAGDEGLLDHICPRCDSHSKIIPKFWWRPALEQLRSVGDGPIVDNTASTWYTWKLAGSELRDGIFQDESYCYVWQMKAADGREYIAQIPQNRILCHTCLYDPDGTKSKQADMRRIEDEKRERWDRRYFKAQRRVEKARAAFFFSPLRVFLPLCYAIWWHTVMLYARSQIQQTDI